MKKKVLVVQLQLLEVSSVVKEEETKTVSLFHVKISLPL